jgi:CheY-like chemotaxis protein
MGDFASQPRLAEAWVYSAGALRAVIENLEHCVYVLNSEGRFVVVNHPFRRWLNRPEADILGRTVFDVWPLGLAERETAENQRVLGGERIDQEAGRPRIGPGGAGSPSVPVRILKVPVHDGEGVVRGVLTMFREVPATGLRDPAASAVAPSRGMEQQTVLLADQDPGIVQLAQAILQRAGYLVLPASSGREALDMYRRYSTLIDVVVLDQHLADLSGMATVNELLAMNSRVRIVLITAGEPPDPSWMARTPGWRFLSKPYIADQLVQAVRDVLTSGTRPM